MKVKARAMTWGEQCALRLYNDELNEKYNEKQIGTRLTMYLNKQLETMYPGVDFSKESKPVVEKLLADITKLSNAEEENDVKNSENSGTGKEATNQGSAKTVEK